MLVSSLIGYFSLKKDFSSADQELFKAIDYGKKVSINGHSMNVEIFGEANSISIILLPGLAQPSPIIDFKPLAEALSEKYKVVVIEPFGYGLSDVIDEERTIENIISEIYMAIKNLGIEKYYLMAHSMSGLYCVHLANQHPEEILGFIGIDTTVPGFEEGNKVLLNVTQSDIISYALLGLKGFDTIGITSLIERFNAELLMQIDKNYKYSDEELEALKVIILKRAHNKTIYNEARAVKENLIKSRDMKFPETVPVLNLISSDNVKNILSWEKIHHDVISETTRSKVITLEGSHLLYHDNKEGILKEVKAWIN